MTVNAIAPSNYQILQGGESTKSSTWGSTIRNCLFGRICDNWEASALWAACAVKVCLAVFNLFSGSFIMSGFLFFTAFLDGNIASKWKSFANLKKENDRYRLNNNRHEVNIFKSKLANKELADKISSFENQNATYKQRLNTHERLNQDHLKNNALQGTLIEKLAKTADENQACVQALDSVMQTADSNTRQALQQCKDLLLQGSQVAKQLETVNTTAERLGVNNQTLLKEANKMQKYFETTGSDLVETIASLKKEREGLKRDVATLGKICQKLESNAAKTGKNAEISQENLKQFSEVLRNISLKTSTPFPAPGAVTWKPAIPVR